MGAPDGEFRSGPVERRRGLALNQLGGRRAQARRACKSVSQCSGTGLPTRKILNAADSWQQHPYIHVSGGGRDVARNVLGCDHNRMWTGTISYIRWQAVAPFPSQQAQGNEPNQENRSRRRIRQAFA